MIQTMPKTMRAMLLVGHGGLDQLVLDHNRPLPSPKAGEALIQVRACGLNNTDVNTRSGWYSKGVTTATTGAVGTGASDDDASWGGVPLIFPRIQGADVVGVVTAVGAGADAGLIGRRVLIDPWLRDWDDQLNLDKTGYFGSECDGGYAEFTTVDQRQVHPIESDYSDAELATFATSYNTAENMLNRANVGSADTVLITGASGGVGSALIQLAKRRRARTVAICAAAKADAVSAVGADAVLPRTTANLRLALQEAIGEDTVSVVADVVGGDRWPQLIDVIKRGGRYTCAGAIAGAVVEFDLRTFYLRDLVFSGATVVPPGTFKDLVGYIERKEICPLLAATYPLEQLREAQQLFMDKRQAGNIVVCP